MLPFSPQILQVKISKCFSCKIVVLKAFAKFKVKHVCKSFSRLKFY